MGAEKESARIREEKEKKYISRRWTQIDAERILKISKVNIQSQLSFNYAIKGDLKLNILAS